MKSIHDILIAAPKQETLRDRLLTIPKPAKSPVWGAVVDGQICDLNYALSADSKIHKWITKDDPEALVLLRHSCAHLLAEAVQCLYPETKLATGPVIKNGFYYDFYKEEPFTTADLTAIEAKMKELVKSRSLQPIEYLLVDGEKLKKWYEQQEEKYKLEILDGLLEKNLPISVYSQGTWFDMCRGPHVPTLNHIGTAFKLLHVSGSYWRGDSRNTMLQRIYGTCWFTQEKLKHYLNLQEDAKKRDHCLLAGVMGLFHIDPQHPGVVFWHPDGWTLYRNIQNYIRRRLVGDYQEVNTPTMLSGDLWLKSGHLEKFYNNMYFISDDYKKFLSAQNALKDHESLAEKQPAPAQEKTSKDNSPCLCLRPMNCPAHVQIYKRIVTSYRQLPIRLSEFGSCFRCEPSGALRGIMRLRNFVQDDAHIFCTQAQMKDEIKKFCELLISVYEDFGFKIGVINLANRPKDKIGDDTLWDHSEGILLEVLRDLQLPFAIKEGEGAFYGPKLEFCLLDALERTWQCGTVQLDFNLPQRFNIHYIDQDGSKQVPVMVHRAILGSIERFLGILLEHYFGFLPAWLAPTQVAVLIVNEENAQFGKGLVDDLQQLNLRVKFDDRNEKLSYKIREHTVKRVPMLCIIGNQEVTHDNVTIRWTKSQKLAKMSRREFLKLITEECALRS